jgi:hypothetical protein
MKRKTLRKSELGRSTNIETNMRSLLTSATIRDRYPKDTSQFRIRYTEGGSMCVVRAVAAVSRGRVQLRMVFDPIYYK